MEKNNRKSKVKKPGTVTRRTEVVNDKKEKPLKSPVSKAASGKKEIKGSISEKDKHAHPEGVHEDGSIFGKNTELIFALLCGAALGTGYIGCMGRRSLTIIFIQPWALLRALCNG
jgi:Cd2+/Zn2+-exporting ATPase